MTSTSLTGLLAEVAAAAPETARDLAVVELRVAEGEQTPIHVHDHDEAFHVVEGEISLHFADRSLTLRAGSSFTAPAGEPHAVSAGIAGARYLTTTYTKSVSGYADFQRAVAPPASDGSFEGADVVRALGESAGITVLGFALSLPATA
jgi:quercetin dioxygenase-like cupin family protein